MVRKRWLGIEMKRQGCLGLGLVGSIVAAISAALLFSTMGGSFFLVMALGIFAGGYSDAQFKERNAVVGSYDTQCLPEPRMISLAQPRCVINGQEGAMLKTVTVTYEVGNGTTKTHFIRYPASWGAPAVGTHITVFAHQRDPDKFKLEKDGWISRKY